MTATPPAPRRLIRRSGTGPAVPAPWIRTRLRSGPGATAALALLVLATSFLAAALPLVLDRGNDRALHSRIAALPTLKQGLQGSAVPYAGLNSTTQDLVQQVSPSVLGEVDRDLRRAIVPPLRLDPANAVYGVRTTAPAAAGELPRLYPGIPSVVDLDWQPGVSGQARLTAGSWPVHDASANGRTDVELQAAVSAATARSLHLTVGALIRPVLPGGGTPPRVRITGVFTPRDPSAGYWTGEPDLAAAQVNWTAPTQNDEAHPYWHLELMLAPGGAESLPPGSLGMYWREPFLGARLHAFQIGAAQTELTGLLGGSAGEDLQANLQSDGEPNGVQLGTDLPTVLAAAKQDQAAVAPMLAIGATGAAGTALTLLLMAAVLAVDRRAEELRLLRSRGMALGGMARRLLGETAAVGLPAAALGIVAAELLLPGPRPGYAAAAGLAVPLVAVLAFPLRALAAHRRAVARPGRQDAARHRGGRRRTVVELGVLALTAAAVAGLRFRGTAAAAGGVDPLVSVAPLLLALAAALLVVRLYPLPLGLLARALARGRSTVLFLGTARAGRSTAGVAVMPLLALLLALSTAAFGATVVLGVDHGRDRAALLQVGADTRFDGTPQLPPGFAAAIAKVPGVSRAVAVRELQPGTGDSGGGGTQTAPFVLVGVDPADYAALSRELGNGGFAPSLLSGPGADGQGAAPALVSPGLAATLGDGIGSYPMNGATLNLRVAGTLPSTPAVPVGADFAVIPEKAELAQLSGAMTPIQLSRNVVLSVDAAQPAALRRAAVAANRSGYYTPVAVTVRQEVLRKLTATPTQQAATRLYVEASAAALLFSLLAVVLSLVQAAPGRAALLSRLRTMGLAPRQGYALTLAESLPSVLLAALGGALLSLALVPLLGPSLDLSALIGTVAPTTLSPQAEALVLPAIGLPALAALVVLLETAVVARRHIATELRAGDRR
ncbi:ABC transporter permease [Streptacidiphilus cavernicola]|uniref:ABC transporter permease n=1 Tax=Streptacidiphilus cavernicola TaxID=3342716 RepID=A0ABV6VSR3_9ACTN